MLKQILKKLLGKSVISVYHRLLARSASLIYGRPSEKLVVIGVTGTNGKSTTVNLIGKILEEAGHKVALTSTVNFKIAGRDWLNSLKMTMPGRFFLQKFLSDAVKAGCSHVIVETSSEGIAQYRHFGIHYDVCVFTNLTPEHLEAHGGFENYKRAKLALFEHLQNMPHKMIKGRPIKKAIIANCDDPAWKDFINFKVDEIITFGQNPKAVVRGENFSITSSGLKFTVGNEQFQLKLLGQFDFYNALSAIATASSFGISLPVSRQALEKVANVPGRMELIEMGQNFKVVVDYAYEPEEMRQVYETISRWQPKRVIQVLGPSGGGRDKGRISVLGEMAGKFASIVLITTDDPYDDDPQVIGKKMFDGAVSAGKKPDVNLFFELDRRKAIAAALRQAQPDDLVLITGKGSDQTMAVKGGYIPWDDREVVREELAIKVQP